ncbi:hypothetical protein [Paenibacillus xylanexedens]|nr:hypothetical protein [Paenibacillus xylanexedens]
MKQTHCVWSFSHEYYIRAQAPEKLERIDAQVDQMKRIGCIDH